MTDLEGREKNGGGQDARTTVARASCPEPSLSDQGAGQPARATVPDTTPVSSREIWARTCSRIALIAGVFSLVLGGLLVINTFFIYRGPGNGKVRLVEGRELLQYKTDLRANPKADALKLKSANSTSNCAMNTSAVSNLPGAAAGCC
ncbi:MAG: hypothetical protein NTV46_13895 [Verrucomicrobia bacterium]|nr:hypothetical protein [Verrucomicrobiota bacterium]